MATFLFSEWVAKKNFRLNEEGKSGLQYSPTSKQFYDKLYKATEILEKPENIEKLLFVDPKTFQDVANDVRRVVASSAYNLPANEESSGNWNEIYEAGQKIMNLLNLLNSPEIEQKAKDRREAIQRMNLFKMQMEGLGAGIYRLQRRIESGNPNLQ
jgi:threonyl-tRNA synthetase